MYLPLVCISKASTSSLLISSAVALWSLMYVTSSKPTKWQRWRVEFSSLKEIKQDKCIQYYLFYHMGKPGSNGHIHNTVQSKLHPEHLIGNLMRISPSTHYIYKYGIPKGKKKRIHRKIKTLNALSSLLSWDSSNVNLPPSNFIAPAGHTFSQGLEQSIGQSSGSNSGKVSQR